MSALPIIGLVGSFVTGFVLGKIASDNENLRRRYNPSDLKDLKDLKDRDQNKLDNTEQDIPINKVQLTRTDSMNNIISRKF